MKIPRMFRLIAFVVVFAVALSSPLARGQSFDASSDGMAEFSLGIGYANVSLSGSDVIDGEGALRFEPAVTFSPIPSLPQLRLGGDVGVTMVLDNSSRTLIINDGNTVYRGSSDVPLWLLEPELRLSWRQFLGADHMFFIEPGVAGGVVFGFLDLDSETNGSYSSDASGAFGRVFLRAGSKVDGGTFGFEASYTNGASLDFGGDASGELQEFYIGIFGALAF